MHPVDALCDHLGLEGVGEDWRRFYEARLS